jgi:hypothetical protein
LTNEPSCKDEARVGQQGTLTRLWAKRGTRPRIKRDRRFTWAYLFGAICPARGTGAALVMPTVSIEAMNQHLACHLHLCATYRMGHSAQHGAQAATFHSSSANQRCG